MTRERAFAGGAREALATIVIASYNHSQYISRALESAFNQDMQHYDVIITDDASTDSSQRVISRLLHDNGWCARTIFHTTNMGLCPTFNEALALVRTQFVAFISADDWSRPERLRTQVRILEDHPSAPFTYGPVITVDSQGEESALRWEDIHGEDWPGVGRADPYLALIQRNFIPAASVLSRTSLLRSVGGSTSLFRMRTGTCGCAYASLGIRFTAKRSLPTIAYTGRTSGSNCRTMTREQSVCWQQRES